MPKRFLLLSFPLLLLAAEPMNVDLTYQGSEPAGKLKTERYDRLEIRVKGEGAVSCYGETHSQKFSNPAFTDYADYAPALLAFFAERLGFSPDAFPKNYGYARFTHGSDTYCLYADPFARGYKYTLLKAAPVPRVVTLPVQGDYVLEKKGLNIPQQPLIPNVEGFAVLRAKYHDYDEVDFYYGREKHTYKGRYWDLDYTKVSGDKNSYRYIIAHDYKAKLKAMGAELLEDKDNDFIFKLDGAVAKFNGYNTSFSLLIVQEEVFKQALILTPDAIKSELDKNGKITLEGIYFDFDKATLKPESHKAILSAVALMQRYSDLVLSVNGYTDDKGSDAYNLRLSADRARAVKAAMEAEGIAASRLSSKGHGEKDPVADNATEKGRAQNRRVELHKEGGGRERSVITIDFIKPIEGAVVDTRRRYENDTLGLDHTKPYFPEKEHRQYRGHLDVIDYKIMKDGKQDNAFSRKAIIKNYENVLELYNAKIVGRYGDQLSFEIPDRGDGASVYGRIDAYDGSYSIRFLTGEEEKH